MHHNHKTQGWYSQTRRFGNLSKMLGESILDKVQLRCFAQFGTICYL